jgi:hypothetical protein
MRRRRSRRVPPPGAIHPYAADGVPDRHGLDRCAQTRCGLPAGHPCHQLPPQPAEVTAHEARRLGEPDDGSDP